MFTTNHYVEVLLSYKASEPSLSYILDFEFFFLYDNGTIVVPDLSWYSIRISIANCNLACLLSIHEQYTFKLNGNPTSLIYTIVMYLSKI